MRGRRGARRRGWSVCGIRAGSVCTTLIKLGRQRCRRLSFCFFFFQAEDGIRDLTVTGVQTCALPIWRVVSMSAYEYFGKRFGYGARAFSSMAFALGHFSKLGFVFYLVALTIRSMTGWDMYLVTIVMGLVTISYTYLGGLEAVIWTDVIQGFIKCIGIFICLGFLLFLPPGGPAAVMRDAWGHGKVSLGTFDFDLT